MIIDLFGASSLQKLVDVHLKDYKHYHSGYEVLLRFKNYAPRNVDTFAVVKILNEMQVLEFQGKVLVQQFRGHLNIMFPPMIRC